MSWFTPPRSHRPISDGEPLTPRDQFPPTNDDIANGRKMPGRFLAATRLGEDDQALRQWCLDVARGSQPFTADHIAMALQVWWFVTGSRPSGASEMPFETAAREAREQMFPDKPEPKA